MNDKKSPQDNYLVNRAMATALPMVDGKFKLPEDGWFDGPGVGEYPNADAGVTQVIDDAALKAQLDFFGRQKQLKNFAGVLVDYDHNSLDASKSSEAAAWLMDMRIANGRQQFKLRFTDEGLKAVEGGRFRFLSTVYPAPSSKLIEKLANGKVRPLYLDRLGLTNDPNMRDIPALSNSSTTPHADKAEAQQPQEKPTMDKILKALGLKTDASEDAAAEAIEALKNRATTAEAGVTQMTSELVESDLKRFEKVIKPENKEKVKTALLKNRASTIELLESVVAADVKGAEQPTQPLTNRAGAKAPATNLTGDAQTNAQKFESKVQDYKLKNRCAYKDAHDAVAATEEGRALLKDETSHQ